MPLNPKDINEERLMALATSLSRTLRVQQYILDRLQPSDDAPHKDHLKLADMRKELYGASDALQNYFLGD